MRIFTGKITVENVPASLKIMNDIADRTDATIVLVDAAKIAGKKHIENAVMHAKRSFEEENAIARTLAMEILVYISGQHQCSRASKLGLHEGENHVYIIIEGGNEEKAEAEVKKYIEKTSEPKIDINSLMKQFKISEEELEVVGESRIEDLVIERVALIDTWK
ncbi:MAG TPA: KEOPS complex subunit Cgi121 [Methanocorpusculum sp.]|nr:KEOPS complex subunit Cgi121 [Methanocorpusculum sp.]